MFLSLEISSHDSQHRCFCPVPCIPPVCPHILVLVVVNRLSVTFVFALSRLLATVCARVKTEQACLSLAMQHLQEIAVDRYYPYGYVASSQEQSPSSLHYQPQQYLRNHLPLHPPYVYPTYSAPQFDASMDSIPQDMEEFQKLSNKYEPELEV